jgi:hypothetical protein
MSAEPFTDLERERFLILAKDAEERAKAASEASIREAWLKLAAAFYGFARQR